MNDFAGYPLSAFLNALRTVIGRIVLGVVAIALGAFLGGLTATTTFAGGCEAVLEFHMLAFISIFSSVGIIALPATLLFAYVFIRFEWPLWTVLLATLLIWWNSHKTIYWEINDSPAAKIHKVLEAAEREVKQTDEESKKKESESPK